MAGIFYAIQHASFRFFDPAGYARFGEPFDQRILDVVRGMGINLLHLHGESILFELAGSIRLRS